MTSLFCHNGPQAKKEWNSTIMVVYFFFFFFEKNNDGLLGSCHIQSFLFYFILFYVHVTQHDNFYFWFFWLNDLLGSCIWLDTMNQGENGTSPINRIYPLLGASPSRFIGSSPSVGRTNQGLDLVVVIASPTSVRVPSHIWFISFWSDHMCTTTTHEL